MVLAQTISIAARWFDPAEAEGIITPYDNAMFAQIFELASLGGYGSRVAESGLGLIPSMAASAPYEDLRLKAK